MRPTVGIATAVVLVFVASAQAATPVWPPSGSSFTTADTETFIAEPAPDESEYMFLFSKGAAFNKTEWFGLGGQDDGDGFGNELELDIGWLATKFDHLGSFSWALCPVTGTAGAVLTDQCSAPSTFSVRFRLSDLKRSQARTDTRYVMNRKFRSFWRGGYNRTVSCTRVTRTRQRCKVFVVVGDSTAWGRVTIYLKRQRTWSRHFFRARIRRLDEYCYLVDKRPLSECQTVTRRSGPVYE